MRCILYYTSISRPAIRTKSYKTHSNKKKIGGKSQQQSSKHTSTTTKSTTTTLHIEKNIINWYCGCRMRIRARERDTPWIEWIFWFHETVDADKHYIYWVIEWFIGIEFGMVSTTYTCTQNAPLENGNLLTILHSKWAPKHQPNTNNEK